MKFGFRYSIDIFHIISVAKIQTLNVQTDFFFKKHFTSQQSSLGFWHKHQPSPPPIASYLDQTPKQSTSARNRSHRAWSCPSAGDCSSLATNHSAESNPNATSSWTSPDPPTAARFRRGWGRRRRRGGFWGRGMRGEIERGGRWRCVWSPPPWIGVLEVLGVFCGGLGFLGGVVTAGIENGGEFLTRRLVNGLPLLRPVGLFVIVLFTDLSVVH